MTVQRLVVHAGLPKTGSSSIQLDLYLNRTELFEQGILYPDTGLYGPGHHLLAHCGYPQDKFEFSPELFQYQFDASDDGSELNGLGDAQRGEHFKSLLVALWEEIEKTDCHTAVLSSEALSNWSGESIELFCNMFNQKSIRVELLFYLRRQDFLLESLIRQNERALHRHFSRPEDIEQLVAHNAFDFNETLKPWITQLGRDNLVLKSFATLREQNKLIVDFRRTIGVEDETKLTEFEHANTSLSRDCVEYIIEQSTTLNESELKSLGHLLEDYSDTHPDEPQWRHYLSPQQRQSVIDRFRSSNFMLAIDLSTDIKKLLPEATVDPEQAWSEYPGLSDDARSQIEDYLRERRKLQQEMDSLPD